MSVMVHLVVWAGLRQYVSLRGYLWFWGWYSDYELVRTVCEGAELITIYSEFSISSNPYVFFVVYMQVQNLSPPIRRRNRTKDR